MLHAAAICKAVHDIQLWLKWHTWAVRGGDSVLGACFICSSLAGCHHGNSCFVASLQVLHLSSLLHNNFIEVSVRWQHKPVSALLNKIRKARRTASQAASANLLPMLLRFADHERIITLKTQDICMKLCSQLTAQRNAWIDEF